MKLPKLNQRGFTLIELLVVVIVISALSGIVVSMINAGGFREKAEDTQRIGDLKQIQTALELYFSDFRQYPNSGGGAWIRITGSDNLSTALVPVYINKIPTDPKPSGSNSDPCGSSENRRYNYRSDGTYYLLAATMAVATSNDNNMCDSLNNWGGCGTFSNQDFCYGVENP